MRKVVDTLRGRCYTLCNTNPVALGEEIYIWIGRNVSVQVCYDLFFKKYNPLVAGLETCFVMSTEDKPTI